MTNELPVRGSWRWTRPGCRPAWSRRSSGRTNPGRNPAERQIIRDCGQPLARDIMTRTVPRNSWRLKQAAPSLPQNSLTVSPTKGYNQEKRLRILQNRSHYTTIGSDLSWKFQTLDYFGPPWSLDMERRNAWIMRLPLCPWSWGRRRAR